MTYLDGMDWAAAQQADQDLKNTWAEVIVRFSQGNYRHANLLHADPHPGNYRFNTDGTVGFVDFGCVKGPARTEALALGAMTRALIEGRKTTTATCWCRPASLAADSDLTADELYQWQSEMVYESSRQPQPATYTPETTARTIARLLRPPRLRPSGQPHARPTTTCSAPVSARHQQRVRRPVCHDAGPGHRGRHRRCRRTHH